MINLILDNSFIRQLSGWLLFLSFYRGLIVIFTGYVVVFLDQYLALSLLFIPPLVLFIPKQFINRIPDKLILSVLLWIGTIFSPSIILKFVTLYIGIALILIVLLENIEKRKHKKSKAFVFILPIDYLLRISNQGQDYIVYANTVSKIVVVIIAVLLIYFLSSQKRDIDLPSINEKIAVKYKFHLFIPFLSIFLLLFIYLADLAAPGIFSIGTDYDFQLILLFTSIIWLLSPIISLLPYQFSNRIKTISISILFGVSLTFYPWYGFTVILWVLAIFTIQYLMTLIDLIPSTKINTYLFSGYVIITLLMFYGLISESYLIVPFIAAISILINFNTSIPQLHSVQFKTPNIKQIIFPALLGIIILSSIFIPANPPTEQYLDQNMSIMSYNLHFGINTDGMDNIEEVVDVIRQISPGIIAFQEVTFAAVVNGYRNMYESLKSKLDPLGYQFSYISEGGKYQIRNLIFSKYPILRSTTYVFEVRAVYERNVISLEIQYDKKVIQVYATHLTHVDDSKSNPNRVAQSINLLDIINQDQKNNKNPIIILGDFNAEPEWEEIKVITSRFNDTWVIAGNGDGYTWPSTNPIQRIDYIFTSSQVAIQDCFTFKATASDHLPVVCDIWFY